ncbi:MAG: Nif3-like dinuclear metal center hexameric protein [Planctomycetes bacterium]|nr:Nif3-like dinuclear metal center hexameric protein [Planctomycetota bacterium]
MNRREFIEAGSLGFVLANNLFAQNSPQNSQPNKELRAKDVNAYLRSLEKVPEPSVDKIIIGDPETVVKKIGTCWMPYWDTCKEAVSQGVNLLIVHEPTFYTHWDLDLEKDHLKKIWCLSDYTKLREEKSKWIRDNGLVIIRCHDVLDKIKGFGIPFALGKVLGFEDSDIVRSKLFYNVYKTPKTPAIKIARDIAGKLKAYGQPGIAFYGHDDYPVSSVGVGTGCLCDPMEYGHLKPDMFIAINDVVNTWVQTTYAQDMGQPLLVIDHGTAEDPGMQALNSHLKKAYPDRDVLHFGRGCSFKWVSG